MKNKKLIKSTIASIEKQINYWQTHIDQVESLFSLVESQLQVLEGLGHNIREYEWVRGL